MGKAEVGTPKYLANKMKAKGLQKLRWYCQMCQKQCRDENGFKCHTMSESHQRQLLLFADNSGRYIDAFSKEFADGYVEILRRQFGTKRVFANKVYQEYISDRNHLHMNATKWLSLSGFVQWLGRTGIAIVDQNEKGWYVTYVDRDPDTLAAKEKLAKKRKMDKDDEERLMDFISKQIERGKKEDLEASPDDEQTASTSQSESHNNAEFVREGDEERIKVEIKLTAKPKPDTIFIKPQLMKRERSVDCSSISSEVKKAKSTISSSSRDDGRRVSALDEIIQMEENRKERSNRRDYWLAEGIVVKLVTKALGDKFYKEKAVVVEVVDKYAAKVKLIESGEKIKIDQVHVETVIPAVGKNVMLLNGAYRGLTATLKNLDERRFCVTVAITSGPLSGRVVNNVQYEDVSKLA